MEIIFLTSLKSITCIQRSYMLKERGSTLLAESGPLFHYAIIIMTFNIKSLHNTTNKSLLKNWILPNIKKLKYN